MIGQTVFARDMLGYELSNEIGWLTYRLRAHMPHRYDSVLHDSLEFHAVVIFILLGLYDTVHNADIDLRSQDCFLLTNSEPV